MSAFIEYNRQNTTRPDKIFVQNFDCDELDDIVYTEKKKTTTKRQMLFESR